MAAPPPARGFTLVELLIVVSVVAIVLAVAIPALRRARTAGNEASAISSLEAINSAQAIFKSVCGAERYATDLPSLGTPMPTSGEPFLMPDLTTGTEIVKAGYVIRMAGEPMADALPACNGAPRAAGYQATADPLQGDGRFFGTNTSRAIYEHTESLAGQMPETGPPPVGRELGSSGARHSRPQP